MDRRLEGDDFPVMVAVPGTIAASTPWQLDPARRPRGYIMILTVTTRRLLVTVVAKQRGFLTHSPRQLVWQLPREAIACAEQRLYSKRQEDVILYFTDASWVRLQTPSERSARTLQEAFPGSQARSEAGPVLRWTRPDDDRRSDGLVKFASRGAEEAPDT
jgi:hypothetical protein